MLLSERVIDRWNSLEQCVIDSATDNAFKNGLRRTRNIKMDFFFTASACPGPYWPTGFWRPFFGTDVAAHGVISHIMSPHIDDYTGWCNKPIHLVSSSATHNNTANILYNPCLL